MSKDLETRPRRRPRARPRSLPHPLKNLSPLTLGYVTLPSSMDVPDSFYDLVEAVCRDLYIQSLKEIPPDVVEAIRRASEQETLEVARRIFSHSLQSIDLGRTKNMIVCQDTGIP